VAPRQLAGLPMRMAVATVWGSARGRAFTIGAAPARLEAKHARQAAAFFAA